MEAVFTAILLTLLTVAGLIVLGPKNSKIQLVFGAVMFLMIMGVFVWSELGALRPEVVPWWKAYLLRGLSGLLNLDLQALLPSASSKAVAVLAVIAVIACTSGLLVGSDPFDADASFRASFRPDRVPGRKERLRRHWSETREVTSDEGDAAERKAYTQKTQKVLGRAKLVKKEEEAEEEESGFQLPESKYRVKLRQREPETSVEEEEEEAEAEAEAERGAVGAARTLRGGVDVSVDFGSAAADVYGERPRVRRRMSRSERDRASGKMKRIKVHSPTQGRKDRPRSRSKPRSKSPRSKSPRSKSPRSKKSVRRGKSPGSKSPRRRLRSKHSGLAIGKSKETPEKSKGFMSRRSRSYYYSYVPPPEFGSRGDGFASRASEASPRPSRAGKRRTDEERRPKVTSVFPHVHPAASGKRRRRQQQQEEEEEEEIAPVSPEVSETTIEYSHELKFKRPESSGYEEKYRHYEWVPCVVETADEDNLRQLGTAGSDAKAELVHCKLCESGPPAQESFFHRQQQLGAGEFREARSSSSFLERSVRGATEAATDYLGGRRRPGWSCYGLIVLGLDFFAIFNLIIAIAHWYWQREVDPVLIGFALAATTFLVLCILRQGKRYRGHSGEHRDDIYITVTEPHASHKYQCP